jgi:hypothetical protein
MVSLTGNWKLNNSKGVSQEDFLKAIGRPAWQISVINDSNEDFRLLHFKKEMKDGKILHFFDKNVRIYLNSKVLSLFASILNIPFNEVLYSHKLIANGVSKSYENDKKDFGPCSSRTTYEDGKDIMTIRWYMNGGILKATHYLTDNNELKMDMVFTNKDGQETGAFKIYDRVDFTENDHKYIGDCKEKAFLTMDKRQK